MRIAQLSKKYGLEKRAIDYYTSLGLIPYTKEDLSVRVHKPINSSF